MRADDQSAGADELSCWRVGHGLCTTAVLARGDQSAASATEPGVDG